MAKSAAIASDAKGMGSIAEQMKSWPQRAKAFYSDVRTEMKKVTSPNRKEVQATTVVVIITVFLFGAYFALIDKIIGTGIDSLLRYFTHR
jgi:preprotein translocase subunit SecE